MCLFIVADVTKPLIGLDFMIRENRLLHPKTLTVIRAEDVSLEHSCDSQNTEQAATAIRAAEGRSSGGEACGDAQAGDGTPSGTNEGDELFSIKDDQCGKSSTPYPQNQDGNKHGRGGATEAIANGSPRRDNGQTAKSDNNYETNCVENVNAKMHRGRLTTRRGIHRRSASADGIGESRRDQRTRDAATSTVRRGAIHR